jgi:hypothetical protein
MPSGYTPLGFIEMVTGEDETVWGAKLNAQALALIDEAIRGRAAFVLSGAKLLTSTNGVDTEGRKAILHATSGTGGTVTIPGYSKLYAAINDTTGDMVITSGGATNATIASGNGAIVACDGAGSVVALQTSDFGGSRLTNVGSPTAPSDAATKAYVDEQAFAGTIGAFPGMPGNGGRPLILRPDESAPMWSVGPVRKATSFTAERGGSYIVDTTSGVVTGSEPAGSLSGDVLSFSDGGANSSSAGWAANRFIFDPGSHTVMGTSGVLNCRVRGASFSLSLQSGDWQFTR